MTTLAFEPVIFSVPAGTGVRRKKYMAGLRNLRGEEGRRVSQQASPRGTFLKIAEVVRARIEADPKMTKMPTAADLMGEFNVSRGVVLRVFDVLQEQGVAERVAGSSVGVVVRRARQHTPALVVNNNH
ncbi:hypothetical protein ACFV9B_41495, partial [Kitasatospora purpeofusca]